MINTLTVQNYITRVQGRLDDIAFSSASLIEYANDENLDICNDAEWPFMQSIFDGTLTIGVTDYNLPTDYQAPVKLMVTSPDSNAIRLKYWTHDRYDNTYPDPSQLTHSMPWMWTTWAETFIVGPSAPDKTYTLRLRYLKEPASITDASVKLDVPNVFAEVVTLGMLARAQAKNDQEDVAVGTWNLRALKYQKLRKRLIGGPSGEVVSGNWRNRSNVIGDALYGPSDDNY